MSGFKKSKQQSKADMAVPKKRIPKALKITISLFVVVVLMITGFNANKIYARAKYVDSDFDNINLDGINNIMIVAHPDDETIWGGAHLLEDNYLVVCVTAGNDAVRCNEFLKALDKTGDKGIMLGYPDKTFGRRNNWKKCDKDIKEDLEKILSLKKWNIIVTHNLDGEYGHIHHKKTSRIVTEIYNEEFSEQNNLYYFGKYYPKDELGSHKNSLTPVNDDEYDKKLDIAKKIYISQEFAIKKFEHMLRYEDWTKYE